MGNNNLNNQFKEEFKKELKNIFDQLNFENSRYIGRNFFAQIDDNLRLKAHFTTLGYAGHYEGISLSIINKTDGVIDKTIVRFRDVLGEKQVANPNFKNGIVPYLWECDNKFGWYVYKPTESDFAQIASEIKDYVQVFTPEFQIAQTPKMN